MTDFEIYLKLSSARVFIPNKLAFNTSKTEDGALIGFLQIEGNAVKNCFSVAINLEAAMFLKKNIDKYIKEKTKRMN